MSLSNTIQRAAMAGCAALAILGGTACGSKAQSASPSALAGDPTTYDGQTVSVSGTAKDPHTRTMRHGGTAMMYQLCDTACIHVFQFGDSTVTDGASVIVTGTFHATFGRVKQTSNVLLVGTRPGGSHWNGSASPSASPGASTGPG
jgi:hypothetical protein